MNQWDEIRSKAPFKRHEENKWVQMGKTEIYG